MERIEALKKAKAAMQRQGADLSSLRVIRVFSYPKTHISLRGFALDVSDPDAANLVRDQHFFDNLNAIIAEHHPTVDFVLAFSRREPSRVLISAKTGQPATRGLFRKAKKELL